MTKSNDWWKKAVIYQVYPKSFKDSNNDGIGDIPGIISKLDYIKNLGVDGLWIGPVYQSPMKDNGYDIADYRQIDSVFGSNEDIEKLIKEAHKREIKVIMDLVANHTSDQHSWFQESKKSKNNTYSNYYIWKDPKQDGSPPNNWGSRFKGSAWEYCEERQQYYLHYYAKEQPDLNWENPKVRNSIYSIMRYWAEKGIDGWRLDVITEISKYTDYPDYQTNSSQPVVGFMHSNGPRVHEFLQEIHEQVLEPYGLMTVGEAQDSTAKFACDYVDSERKELDMIFTFEHMDIDAKQNNPNGKWELESFKLSNLKKVLNDWQISLDEYGWNALYFENHDRPRVISRWGNDTTYRYECATAFATVLHGLKGTPYIFQGEEIGMTNIKLPINQYDDIEIKNNYEELVNKNKSISHKEFLKAVYQIGRDNGRTPMQWNASKNAGFTGGNPWFYVNPRYKEINVENALADKDSIYHYYKELIRLRHEEDILTEGTFEMILLEDEFIFAYFRKIKEKKWLIVANFSEEEQAFYIPDIEKDNEVKIILSNYENSKVSKKLKPFEAYIAEI